jgi:uncharacterized Zn finger protein (UPF0148 family)
VSLLKTRCPECSAPLKSSSGFTVGQTVCCPKCETYFAVEEPEKEKDESEEDEAPKATAKSKANDAPAKKPLKVAAADEDDGDEKPKKKRKKPAYDEDEEPKRSYKNSPLRYAILGVLLVIMCVLGYMLIEKRKKEREVAGGSSSTDDVPVVNPRVVNPQGGPQLQPIIPNMGGVNPNQPNPKQPNPNQPNPKQPNLGGGGPPIPLGGLVGGGGPIPGSPEAQALTQALTTALVGTWTADLGDGVTEELTYTAAGTYTQKRAGPTPNTVSGKYVVKELVGSKGLKVQLDTPDGPRTVRVTFESDELQHPTLQPGVTGAFRKK